MVKFTETPAKTVLVHAHCDCGGLLDHVEGLAFLTHPVRYPHICKNCGKQYDLDAIYPKAEVRPADDAAGGSSASQDLMWALYSVRYALAMHNLPDIQGLFWAEPKDFNTVKARLAREFHVTSVPGPVKFLGYDLVVQH